MTTTPASKNVFLTPGQASKLMSLLHDEVDAQRAQQRAAQATINFKISLGLDPSAPYKMDEDTGEMVPLNFQPESPAETSGEEASVAQLTEEGEAKE